MPPRSIFFVVFLTACSALRTGTPVAPPGPGAPRLFDAREIASLISPKVKDRAAWGQAVSDALAANSLPADASSVCAVLSLIAQESTFHEDPPVPGLAKLAEGRVAQYESKLGPLGRPIFHRILSGRAPADPRTFEQRLHLVKTERDLDLLFRDMVAYYQSSYPGTFEALTLAGKLFDGRSLGDVNPITTAGPMQVSVKFAEAWARDHHGQVATVRDSLYTRAAGVYFGTVRLFAAPAGYDKMLFRFADYNAGMYASRNAALQSQLSRLTGRHLALDGDILSYDKEGEPRSDVTETMQALRAFRDRYAPTLGDRELRRDAEQEKTLAFEGTETFRAVKAAYLATGQAPEYAILPDLVLESPKITRKLSTAWFAQSVDRRYQACLIGAAAR
jgi:hypothetical protein